MIARMWPTILVTALYAVQVVILLSAKDWRAALVFTGYAIANVGIIAAK